MVITPNYDLDIDTTLGGNNASDYVVPSQKAIKAYVDNSTGGNVMWGNIAGNISNQTDLQDALDDKQDALVSGSNIKTINSTSILGSGNISVATSAQGALADTALQPNDNISELTNNAGYITSSALAPYALSADLSTVATSGSYNDLTNKPTIPAAQVNSDWNASSGVAQILNKPTLATVATSGSYSDLSDKPTIPDTSNLANKDLSNLSSTGNAKFQAPLVSGTNIKTVNGNSLLGSGDLTIQGGASYSATCPAITPVDGVATWSVTHNLGTQAVVTALYSNGNKVEHNTLVTSNNAITVTFKASSAVTAGSYKIVVLASGGAGGGSADDTYTSATTNVGIIGSLTNNNGVISGFATGNYATFPTNFAPASNPWEIVLKVKFDSEHINLRQEILGGVDNLGFIALRKWDTNLLFFDSSVNGTSWGNDLLGTTIISADIDYYIKLEYTGSEYNLYVSTTPVFTTPEATRIESSPINRSGEQLIGTPRFDYPPYVSVDLKECYININGSRWWTGADYSELTGLSPVTDYYISGSSWYKETFSDATRTKRIWLEQGGVASSSTATINLLKSFSNTNYVVTGGASNKTTSSFTLTSNANWVAIGV